MIWASAADWAKSTLDSLPHYVVDVDNIMRMKGMPITPSLWTLQATGYPPPNDSTYVPRQNAWKPYLTTTKRVQNACTIF